MYKTIILAACLLFMGCSSGSVKTGCADRFMGDLHKYESDFHQAKISEAQYLHAMSWELAKIETAADLNRIDMVQHRDYCEAKVFEAAKWETQQQINFLLAAHFAPKVKLPLIVISKKGKHK